jgi:hypothetical protein
MVEPPGPDRMKHAPGHDADHDPANDPLRPRLRWCAHEFIVCIWRHAVGPLLCNGPARHGVTGLQPQDSARARRTIEEPWAAAAHSDETFAGPERRARGLPKGPRNGPGTRGAENLDRFRERLDGMCRGPLTRGRRRASVLPLTSRGLIRLRTAPWPSGGRTVGKARLPGQGRSQGRFSKIFGGSCLPDHPYPTQLAGRSI